MSDSTPQETPSEPKVNVEQADKIEVQAPPAEQSQGDASSNNSDPAEDDPSHPDHASGPEDSNL